jgi:hypothetical protein
MSWGTRHDGDISEADWDLGEGYLQPHELPAKRRRANHSPSGEADGDDGAGNPSPREEEIHYGADDEETREMPIDDWTRADSDEARF